MLERGAAFDVKKPGALYGPLANHAPCAAEKMIDLGAKPDICAAAALGRMDLLRDFFDNNGKLRSRPRRAGKLLSARDPIGLAMLFAYVNHRQDAVDYLLEKDGNWNMIGVNHGTALHRAAWDGDLADGQAPGGQGRGHRRPKQPVHGDALVMGRSQQAGRGLPVDGAHCSVDLHDAVSFDLRDHVEARLREDPQSVNQRIDHWNIPQGTPLHTAAALNREELARLLLEKGADPSILAGNGLTALDVADAANAAAVVALLENHGAQRSREES